MEKWKLMYIKEQCERIADGLERIGGCEGGSALHIYKSVHVQKGIDVIAAALKRPVKIKCMRGCYWRTVTYGSVEFEQMGFYSNMS